MKTHWQDKDEQKLVGQILRIGVSVASSVILIGGIFYLYHHGEQLKMNYSHFHGEEKEITVIPNIIKGAFELEERPLIQFGVLLLICTPIFRVLGSLIGFILEKDKLYMFITSLVLCIILFSLFSGIKG